VSRAYYNEFDPKAAAWIRQLIADGLIMPGDVDTRSIKDVTANDLRGYIRHHFFAGIGGWDVALRLAGWPVDRPVFTGSCPCQPFSQAGKQKGQADERHLWPEFYRLIREYRPATVIGEQVESAIGHGWLDGVFSDLEGIGYACGSAVLGAFSVGSPHKRNRLWFVADATGDDQRWTRERIACDGCGELSYRGHRADCRLANADSAGLIEHGWPVAVQPELEPAQRRGGVGSMAYAGHSTGCTEQRDELQERDSGTRQSSPWDDYILVPCRDGKARRIKSGLSPLAHGLPRGVVPSCDPSTPGYAENTGEARVMRLKGYGNAIVPSVAAEFIAAFMETEASQ
jgi:DNA (cytosine-5)-methyltransferase 1